MDTTAGGSSGRNWSVNFAVWAAIFVVLHPLSVGPLVYLEARGWLNTTALRPVVAVFYAPEIYVLMYDVPYLAAPSDGYRQFVTWCQDLGRAHAVPPATATPVSPTPP